MKHYCNVSGGSLSGGLGNFGLFGAKRVVFSKCDFVLMLFCKEKLKDVLRSAECCLFWRKMIIHCYVQFHSSTFRNRKDCKRFSRLSRRRESVASSPRIRLSSVMLFSSSEILYLRSQMLRTARWGWYLSRCFS